MKKHIVILEIEEVDSRTFNSNFSIMGNDHAIAQGFGAAMRRDARFRTIILEAIDNMVAGVDMEITARDPNDALKEKGEKID